MKAIHFAICLFLSFLNIHQRNSVTLMRLNQKILFDQFHYNRESITINLNDAHIESVDPRTFSLNLCLEWLVLANNRITYLDPGTFFGLIHLKQLWLSDNQLSKLENGLLNELKNLKVLYFHSNQISQIDERALHGLVNLQEVHFVIGI